MRDEEKSKAQLIQELWALREQLADRGGGAEPSARVSEQALADSEARNRALLDQLRRQRLMLDGSSERIMATDLEGRVLYANAAFARQVGRSPEELVGVQLTTLPGRPLEGADGRDVLEAVVLIIAQLPLPLFPWRIPEQRPERRRNDGCGSRGERSRPDRRLT